MADWLEAHGVELVVCAGYMHLLTPSFLERFPERVVNVHPGPLPEFPGAHPLEDLLDAGAHEAAATVHYVDAGIDTGPVIASEPVPVLAGDTVETLRERVHAVEHRLLPEVVRTLCAQGEASLAPTTDESSSFGSRQDRPRAVRPRPRRPRVRARRERRHRDRARRRRARHHARRRAHGLPGDARRAREDAPPARPCRHPRAARAAATTSPSSKRTGIEPFDLVCVNLYPFELVADRAGMADDDVIEMIDVGGPSMLRAAAKNFASVTAVCETAGLRRRARGAPGAQGQGVARDAAAPRRDRVRDERRIRVRDRALVPARGRSPGDVRAGVRPRARPRIRREPAPACRVLRRAWPSRACPLARRPARGEAALVQQPQRPLRGATARARARRARVRDREAREPVRCRGGGDDRGGVRERRRGRPGLGVRRGRRPEPRGHRRPRRGARRAVHRGPLRAGVRRAGDAGALGEGLGAGS